MQHSSDFPSFYLFLRAGLKPAVFFLVATLLCATPLQAQALKKVPFPFSPIGLNCLPWFVAKDARIFEKHGIDLTRCLSAPLRRCSTPCYQARRMWPDRADPR